MKGLLTLPHGMVCMSEVLGNSFHSKIDGIPIEISFPRFNSLPKDKSMRMFRTDNPLLAPAFAENWRRGDEKLHWGYPMSYSDMTASVELIALSVNCDIEQEESIANRIYEKMYRWIRAFVNYCDLVSKQNSHRDENLLNDNSEILFFNSEGGIGTFICQTMHVHIRSGEFDLSCQQIEDALRFAESDKEFTIEYQLLLSAYNARRNCQNRHAIIDACSAAEQALNQIIAKYAEERKIEVTILTSKYRTLGDKFKLVKQTNGHFPDIDTRQIVDLRNDVAHNRRSIISDEETDKLLCSVELLLQNYFPQYY